MIRKVNAYGPFENALHHGYIMHLLFLLTTFHNSPDKAYVRVGVGDTSGEEVGTEECWTVVGVSLCCSCKEALPGYEEVTTAYNTTFNNDII